MTLPPTSAADIRRTPEAVLKEYFGYDQFRPMQRDIIASVLGGRDTLVLMPTGGGKSVCYQVPAMVMPGTCVVLSPLIALMKDQVEGLKVNGIEAAFINSTQSAREQSEVERRCMDGSIKLLYVSPEKLFTEGFQWLMRRMKINLFAIDEAHCISFWGHDFRPEYAQLRILKEQFPNIPIVALTATADRLTRKDIVTQLRLDAPAVFISSFDRPNLRLNVMPGIKRTQCIMEFLAAHPKEPGIIYCLSRKSTETLADKLIASGYRANAYHAGLSAGQRSKVQDAFLKDDVQIVCATIAFGMGIDKSNVRWVVHYNLPKNIESYYQEIGRAGRDGAPAEALLLYTYSDVALQQERLAELQPDHRALQQAKLDRLQQYSEALFCRRKVLLNYFNEDYTAESCGNCDNCANPRKMVEGTVIAQKALSAVARMQEKGSLTTLIDVLRGSRTQPVMRAGFHEIKTFGAGRELKPLEWREYTQQLINLGYLDIAYEDAHHLRLTPKSKKVLFEGEKVLLAQPQINVSSGRKETESPEARPKPKRDMLEEELFEQLRKLRKEIADENGLPPYIIFNDNTLKEMARAKPTTRESMMDIPGMGVNKYNAYGEFFLDAIIKFIKDKTNEGDRIKGGTHLVTFENLKQGMSPEDIAKVRNIHLVTVYSHIATLYEEGYQIPLDKYLPVAQRAVITDTIKKLGGPATAKLKDIFDALEGQHAYHLIRLALAYMAKQVKGS